MKTKCKIVVKNILVSFVILIIPFVSLILAQNYIDLQNVYPMIFVLAVFLISLLTNGYSSGIVASLLSVLAVNFAFTFPYFALNFSIPVNLLSAVIMLSVSIITSALTTKIKIQQNVKAEIIAEKMRGNLLRAISHDIRTPLTSIYGSCSTVIENYDLLKKEQQLKLLGEVRSDCEWLIRIVENLLSVTRIDGKNLKVVKTPIVLEELIDESITKFNKQYPNQSVEIDIPEEFISIPMDALLIEQVVINILENAVRHADGMTHLYLRVFTNNNCAIFEIEDDGNGIPREKLGTIFSGHNLESSNNEIPSDNSKKNMGIGLSVCAAIIKAHDGTIEAENKKGSGALFRFSLNMEETKNEQ